MIAMYSNKIFFTFIIFINVSVIHSMKREPEEELCPLKEQKKVAKPERQEELSAFEKLPLELKEKILGYLVTAPGNLEPIQLYRATENIRALMELNTGFARLFLNDARINGYLVNELAKRFTGGDKTAVVIALNTKGASDWLRAFVSMDSSMHGEVRAHLVDAVNKDQFHVVKFILNSIPKPIISMPDRDGVTPLMYAARNGNTLIVKELISAGAKVNMQDAQDWTALMNAASKNYTEIISMLIDAGADVNMKAKRGWTALMAASQCGNESIIRILLSKGALVNAQTSSRWTPLMYAAASGHLAVVDMFLSAGAHVNLQTQDGSSALMLAAQNGHLLIVEKLLANDAQVNQEDENKRTALIYAVEGGYKAIVEKLLAAGADVVALSGRSALWYAEKSTSPDKQSIIKLLKSSSKQ